MKDFVTSAFKLGLGAMDLSREQAEQLLDRLQQEYGAEIKDGRAMIEEMVEQAEKYRKKIEAHVEKEVARTIKAQKLISEEELKKLVSNVRDLARQVNKVARSVAKGKMKKVKQAKAAKKSKKGIAKRKR